MTSDLITTVSLVFVGWLLALLSPAIHERIRLRYLRQRVINGVVSELTEFRENCAVVTLTIEANAGRLSKELLTWCRSFRGDIPLPPPLDQFTEAMQNLERIDDVDFRDLVPHMKSPSGGGLNLKELDLPYTKLKIADLELFSETARRHVLEILSRIRMFNQHVEESRFFFKLTFDGGISSANHASAQKQVQAAYDAASLQSRLIADLISLALVELNR